MVRNWKHLLLASEMKASPLTDVEPESSPASFSIYGGSEGRLILRLQGIKPIKMLILKISRRPVTETFTVA